MRVYFTNHFYFSDRHFGTVDEAIEYGKSKGFEFQVRENVPGGVRAVGPQPENPNGDSIRCWNSARR